MPEIEIALTDAEHRRLQHVAEAVGKSVEQLVADELRARYALRGTGGQVVPMRGKGNSSGRD